MSSLKKDPLEQQDYFRILAGMKNKDKPGQTLEELAKNGSINTVIYATNVI